MVRRSAWLLVLVSVAGLLRPPVAQAVASEPPPNVVLIFADDLGYGDLGCYGARQVRTPNLDSLARDGTRFTNFHVSQPVCSASRASLLTGCYANRLGIHGALGPNARHGLAAEETTLAEMLRARGYATGMVGKWHLGHHTPFLPLQHGFDEFLGLPYSNDMWPGHPEVAPGAYPALPLIDGDRIVDANVTARDQAELTGRYTDRAVRFVERHAASPFFLYVAYTMPHVPLFAGERFRGKSAAGLFGDVIEEIDDSVGRILEAVRRTGTERRTLVIFTSDNGPWLSYGDHAGSAGPLREGKGTVWEGGVRVPCLLRWPGTIPAGRTNDRMWMTIDLLPTLAGLTGAAPPPLPIDGKDVWPLLVDRPGATNPHEAYALYYLQGELQAVITGDGRWKLVLPHTYRTLGGKPGGTAGKPSRYEMRTIQKPELYRLSDDRSERRDLAALHPDERKRLEGLAADIRGELGDSLTKTRGRGVREPGRLPR